MKAFENMGFIKTEADLYGLLWVCSGFFLLFFDYIQLRDVNA